MGQAIRGLPETPALNGPSPKPPEPVGRWLARERRLRGLSLEDVSAVTRIPRRSLERLEAGAFDSSPDGFSRGFVRAVADAIGLDPREAQARLLGEVAAERRRRGLPRGPAIAAAILALALVACAIALSAWWPERQAAPVAESAPAPELRRRDFVRELAAKQAGSPPAPAAPLP